MGAIEDAKKAFAAIHPQGTPNKANRLSVSGGKIEMTVISVIEDLLSDYEYFIGMAISTQNKLEEKRYLRASCLALNAYIEGSLNVLYEIHISNKGKSESEISNKLRFTAFHKKSRELESTYLSTNATLKRAVQDKLRDLRNNLLHFKGNNIVIWDALTIDEINEQKQIFECWIAELHKSMKISKCSSEDEINFFRSLMGAFGIMTSEINLPE